METQDEKFLGTYHSLKRLKRNYPHHDLAFVLGADNLMHLDRWINAEKLLEEFRFIVVNRHKKDLDQLIDKNELLKKYKDHFLILNNFHSNISSTLFRETLDPYYVDEDIYHYIMKNDLYRGNQ
jgi:nicotinate-nucleotide adenylyltransferase